MDLSATNLKWPSFGLRVNLVFGACQSLGAQCKAFHEMDGLVLPLFDRCDQPIIGENLLC
ncbi:hypothetical protein M513_03960 [Trichuris suis]|uniref:Uncharacterized protein n=1 Tax=Trichuris suis TaxID=68888 RepID=A0A085MCU6_9BILA|nr:hypothetical protein M513_03960 [Trichuris suis]